FGALVVSVLIHLLVVWYEMREGRRLRSEVLVADASHTRADVLVSIAVMGGLVAVRLGYPLADPILALVVAIFIGRIGIHIVRENVPALLDHKVLAQDEIEEIALSVPGVDSCHRIRSRGHNQEIYADLHIRVAPEMSTSQAHALAHEVQRRLRARRPDIRDVTVHVEPSTAAKGDESLERITARLRRVADGLGIGVHEVNAYQVNQETFVEAHLEMQRTISLEQAHELASLLEERARHEIPGLAGLTTHIEPEGNVLQNGPGALQEAEIASRVQELLRPCEGLASCHDIRARRGDNGWVVSLHCHLPGEMSLTQAHEFSAALERRIREGITGIERVVIHAEPDGE
ncbi:MAG: cation-efflux pump, partial [Chloroflexia bacterium]